MVQINGFSDLLKRLKKLNNVIFRTENDKIELLETLIFMEILHEMAAINSA